MLDRSPDIDEIRSINPHKVDFRSEFGSFSYNRPTSATSRNFAIHPLMCSIKVIGFRNNESSGEAFYVSLDVTDLSSWQDAVDTAVSRFGKLDISLCSGLGCDAKK